LVNFDPTVGAEIQKTRPALILQNDVANQYGAITIVAAVTSYKGDKLYPTEVLLKASGTGLRADSVAVLNQIRSIDKQRLARKLGRVDSNTMHKIGSALQISLGLIDL